MSAGDREEILDEAKSYVTKDRNTSYGEPEDNFSNIAEIWNAQLSHKLMRPLDATDVSLLMTGMKLARLKHNPTHRDSWADGIGYLACGYDVAFSDTLFVEEQIRAEANMPIITDEPLKGWREAGFTDETVSPKVEPINDVGWVSDNRCNMSNPHVAHPYGRNSEGPYTPGKGYWCDGYVAPVRESDVDVVKRVADKLGGRGSSVPVTVSVSTVHAHTGKETRHF